MNNQPGATDFGTAHVAYLPDGKVLGLNKIPRIVEMYARWLQVQERMTSEIAGFLQEVLQPPWRK